MTTTLLFFLLTLHPLRLAFPQEADDPKEGRHPETVVTIPTAAATSRIHQPALETECTQVGRNESCFKQ